MTAPDAAGRLQESSIPESAPVRQLIESSSFSSPAARALRGRTPEGVSEAIRTRLIGVGFNEVHPLGVLGASSGLETERYGSRTVCEAVGITYQQLSGWVTAGLVHPSTAWGGVKERRQYSLRDCILLLVSKRLLEAGLSLSRVRDALAHLDDRNLPELGRTTLLRDGRSLYEVVDVLRTPNAEVRAATAQSLVLAPTDMSELAIALRRLRESSSTAIALSRWSGSSPDAERPRWHADASERFRREALAVAIRSAIETSGMSLRQLEARLRSYGEMATSVATLSSWQSGVSAPQGTTSGRNRILALERVLGLPAGDLALLLPLRRAGEASRLQDGRHPGRLVDRHSALRRQVEGFTDAQLLLTVSISKEYRLGRDRHAIGTTVRQRVRALSDHADRYWLIHTQDTLSKVSAIQGCRIGRTSVEAVRPGPTLAAVELIFDRPLQRGEFHEFSFSMIQSMESRPTALADRLFRHIQVLPCQELDLTLIFDPGGVPSELSECRWKASDLAEVAVRPRNPTETTRLVIVNPTPGGYGWRWRW